MILTDIYYWCGVTATAYVVTCWIFSVVRGIHNCGTPKERRDYIWPDRKQQVLIYSCATMLLPYILNPQIEAAWILMKSGQAMNAKEAAFLIWLPIPLTVRLC